MIGHLTVRTRKIRIINMLTKHEDVLEVCLKNIFKANFIRYRLQLRKLSMKF